MPTYEIHEFPENHPLKRFTFTVDGKPSLYWSATRPAIERVVNRLKLGRSGEAFGGSGLTTAGARLEYASLSGEDRKARAKIELGGEVTVEETETKSGKKKAREKRPGYVVTLDGTPYDGGTTEAGAKELAAVGAFMTRGKLGVKDEARAAFKDATGKDCKVHHVLNKLVAKDEDGNLWWVGVALGAPLTRKYRFKPVINTADLKLGAEIGGIALKKKE